MSLKIKISAAINWKLNVMEAYFLPLVLLVARIFMARIFWRSGQTKTANIDSTIVLFKEEYLPNWVQNSKNVFGQDLSWTVPDPSVAAHMSIAGELGLSILLVMGLAGRFAALGLLVMAMTIELFIYPGTPEHYYWMVILMLLAGTGPGRLSIDYYVRRLFLTSREKSA